MNKSLIAQLAILFLITQILGIIVALDFVKTDTKATIVSEDTENVSNAFALIAYILVFTLILILAIKYFKGFGLVKVMEILAVFGTSWIVFDVFIPQISLMLALLVVGSRIFIKESIFLKNIASVIAVAGAGALLGVSLGVTPVLVFIIALAVYDLIAVFKTKHMVFLAKHLSDENLSFTVSMPTKEHLFQMGTGDLIIPLVFSVSVLNSVFDGTNLEYAIILPILLLLGSLVGLLGTLYYTGKQKRALPALPMQVVLMLIIYLIGSFVF